MNLYADIARFQQEVVNDARLDPPDADSAELLLDATCRAVDEYLRRHVFAETNTIVLSGKGKSAIRIPDLLTVTSIKLDENGDRTFEVTLGTTSYYLKRYGHEDEDALPSTLLLLDGVNGTRSAFPAYPYSIEIVGRWGYVNDVERLPNTGTLTDAADTSLALNTGEGSGISRGQTLKLESEDIYVADGAEASWTVKRGVNGTTAAAHTAVAIDRYTYPPAIVKAVLMKAGRTWSRRASGYASVLENTMTGQVSIYRKSDPEVCDYLDPHRRGDRMVA
jgi:hypothetical protein